jgi:nucleoid-associated protein
VEIKNIILHEVDRKSASNGSTYIGTNIRPDENPINENSTSLVKSLSGLFRKTGLSSGHFREPENEDEDKPKLERLLDKYYVDGAIPEFWKFSDSVARHLKAVLETTKTAKGGYLWINCYEHGNEFFVSLVILRKKDALQIKNLSLDKVEEIDLDKLHMAARINISQWNKSDPLLDRYIAFKVGKSSTEVTDYFQDFIGCSEAIRAKRDTDNLVNVTIQFCKEHQFDEKKTDVIKRDIEELCLRWHAEETPVLLDKISEILDNTFVENRSNKGRFLEIAQGEPYFLTNEVRIHKSSLRKLRKYMGSSKKLNISFDSDLLGKSVIFDKYEKSLTITEIPDDLLGQLINDD